MDRRIIEMGIIWLIIILIAVLMLSCRKVSKRMQSRVCLIIAIGLSLLSSVRTIGWDIPNYRELYQFYFVPFWNSFSGLSSFVGRSYEPLNYLLALLFGQNGFRAYLFVTCVFPLLIAWHISKRYANPLLFFGSFLLINFSTIDQTRQFFASGFLLLGYVASSTVPTLLCNGLTVLAHYGTAPAMVIGFVKKRRPSQCNLLFLGLIIFFAGKAMSFIGADSVLGVLAGRMSGYFDGFFSATNILRIIFYFYLPVTSILFLSRLSSSSLETTDDSSAEQNRYIIQAENSFLVASVVFVALLLGTGSDVISTRLFYACGIGNFLLVGRYLQSNLKSKAFMPCILWLISLNIAWSAQYFYGFIT